MGWNQQQGRHSAPGPPQQTQKQPRVDRYSLRSSRRKTKGWVRREAVGHADSPDLNYEAENTACKIRLRAERRCGELLREMKKKGERRAAAKRQT